MRKAFQLIDDQHDTILEFVTSFEQAVQAQADRKSVRKLIERTREFAQFHFVIEESLMQIVKYPRFAAHRAEHRQVLEQIASIEERINQHGTGGEWLALLRTCLLEHFDDSDRHFSQYANDRYRDEAGSLAADGSPASGGDAAIDVFAWHQVLSTGHAAMDLDHKKLADLLALLGEGLNQRMGGDFCHKVIEDLIRAAKEHFDLEERIMAECRYPMRLQHADEHAMLIAQLRDFMSALEVESSSAHAALVQFAEVWLSFHILFSDKKFADFLAAVS